MKKLIIVSLVVLSSLSLFAQNKDKSNLPEMLGTSNAGKKFWLNIPSYIISDTAVENLLKKYATLHVKPLASVEFSDTLAPAPIYTLCCDGKTCHAMVTDLPDDPSIRSNLSMIVLQSDVSFNYLFKYDAFIPGESRKTSWSLEVIDPDQDARAVITFSDRGGNDTTIDINYHARKYTIKPNPVDFGTFKLGEEKTIDFWAVNYSEQSEVTIENLKFMMNYYTFTFLLPKPLPWTIRKKDSVKFQVKFTANEEGEMTDSIGLGDYCLFFYKAKVHATVFSPVINVIDVDFDNVSVKKTAIKDFFISNQGNVDLVIYGYTGPSNSCFSTNLPMINQKNPLILKPNEIKTFQLTFSPNSVNKYEDKIIFTSDAGTNFKNYCSIYASSSKPNLKANNFDWGNKKIDSTYPEASVITLANDGNENIYVSDMTILTDINGDAFEFDRKKITSGLTIRMNSSENIPVVFHPTKIGLNELKISFDNSADIVATTTLSGYGTLTNSVTDLFNSGINIITQNEQLLIELPENSSGDYSVSIFDLKGTQVYSKKDIPATFSNRIIIDCGNFANGTYLLNLVSSNKYYIKKFVINR